MSLEYDSNGEPFIHLGSHRIRLEREDLNEEMKKKAKDELRETPEVVENGIRELRRLLAAEPDLYVPLDMDDYLIKFLRPCKFYATSAADQIKKFYEFKKKHKLYCEHLIPSKDRTAFVQGLVGFQEARDHNHSRIMIIEAGGKWVPSKCSLVDMFRAIQLALEAAMVEPNTQVGGVVVIFNMLGFSLTHVVQITPSFAKMVVDWIQECIPIRLKGIHIVNQPYVFNMVYAIFKPFLNEKIRNRIHFHGSNFDHLKKHIPSDSLRSDFKGTMDMPELPGHLLADLLCKYEEDFALADSFGYKGK